MFKKTKPLRDLIEDAPKTLNRDYLQNLNFALFYQKLESDIEIESIVSSLLLEVIDDKALPSNRHFAYVILQKLHYAVLSSKIISADLNQQLVHALPILIAQPLTSDIVADVIKKLVWYICNENWAEDIQCHVLAFLCKAITLPKSPLTQDDMEKLFALLSSWLIIPLPMLQNKSLGFRRSSSSLSITEVDGTDIQDIFSVLNSASNLTSMKLRSIYAFSVLKSSLCPSNEDSENFSKQVQPFLEGFASDSLNSSIQEYCMRIIDQVDRKVQSSSVWKFQKLCLLEAVELLNAICFMDSGIIHSIFPMVRRIYDKVSSNLSGTPEIEEITILSSCMQFFINHGRSVMHKPDSLYVFLFCDMLSLCYKDNCIAYEILSVMRQNISKLCYHSSILEKYFPTFLKVFAWHADTFALDFQDILPAFMSQHTSMEIFHSLLDLPCLTSVQVLMDNKSCMEDPKMLKDSKFLDSLKKPEISSIIKFLLRETSGSTTAFESINLLHRALQNLASHNRVVRCSKAVIPLLKCYFQVLIQYADMSVSVLIIHAILDRVSVIYPVPNYSKEVNAVLGDYIRKLFKEHPEAVFHCQKNIIMYLSQFKNYFIAERCFLHVTAIVGEYVTPTYSNMCKPETISLYFENLETTAYEALSCLKDDSDDYFLKFLSIISVSLSKLAARNQDQVPRAVLYLTKLLQQLKSFGNSWKKSWCIVTERVQEMLGILSEPSIAAVILNPPKDLLSGRYHRDPTSLANVLRTITAVVNPDS